MSGKLFGLQKNSLNFYIKDGNGIARCSLEENQRPKLITLNNKEKIDVTGTIENIHWKPSFWTTEFWWHITNSNENVVHIMDCQVGQVDDRVGW